MLDYSYTDLVTRLNEARSWATGVTEGNRCAFVVGVALNVKPLTESQSFRSVKTGLVDGIKGQQFLAKFFLKAQDLAGAASRRFGPPDVIASGNSASATLASKQGVIFMADCWGGLRFLGITLREQTYDHIDLWDGATLEIYKGKHSPEEIRAFVARSRSVWFWEVKKKSVSA